VVAIASLLISKLLYTSGTTQHLMTATRLGQPTNSFFPFFFFFSFFFEIKSRINNLFIILEFLFGQIQCKRTIQFKRNESNSLDTGILAVENSVEFLGNVHPLFRDF
jgi:hypothetical protein